MVFIKRRRWVIGMVLLIGIMLFNLPKNPSNGYDSINGNVAFDWIGQASFALVDDNKMFTSPVIVNKGAILELEPGIYYWRVSGFGVINKFEIDSLLGIETEENDREINVKNSGNEDAEIEVKSSGVMTGLFVLDENTEKKIENGNNIEIFARAVEND